MPIEVKQSSSWATGGSCVKRLFPTLGGLSFSHSYSNISTSYSQLLNLSDVNLVSTCLAKLQLVKCEKLAKNPSSHAN